jgi:RNA polymerase sigma factor (sigma-70 family)
LVFADGRSAAAKFILPMHLWGVVVTEIERMGLLASVPFQLQPHLVCREVAGASLADQGALTSLAVPSKNEGDVVLQALQLMKERRSVGLDQFYDALGAALYGAALRMLRSEVEAEEAVQDAFVKCWDRAVSYDESKGRPYTWAMMILRGECLDRLRRRQRRERLACFIPLQSGDADYGETIAAECSGEPGDRLDIEDALASLSDSERHAIQQAVFCGVTHQELAVSLGEPLGSTKSRVRRALIKIHQFLHPAL